MHLILDKSAKTTEKRQHLHQMVLGGWDGNVCRGNLDPLLPPCRKPAPNRSTTSAQSPKLTKESPGDTLHIKVKTCQTAL